MQHTQVESVHFNEPPWPSCRILHPLPHVRSQVSGTLYGGGRACEEPESLRTLPRSASEQLLAGLLTPSAARLSRDSICAKRCMRTCSAVPTSCGGGTNQSRQHQQPRKHRLEGPM